MKPKYKLVDKIKYNGKIGIIQSRQYMDYLDMYIYLIKFDEFEIVLRENELEKV